MHWQRLRPACQGVQGDTGSVPVAVPRDDLRALTGVGRSDLLADDGIEKGGLSGFDHSGHRNAQRPGKALVEVVQDSQGSRVPLEDLPRLPEQLRCAA